MKALVFRHAEHELPGRLGVMMRDCGFDIRTVDLGAGETVPARTEGADALVLMGGPMGVYETDKYSYLAPEIRFVKRFMEDGGPVIGICLGAQIMAAALGAGVSPGPGKEIGWYQVCATAEAAEDPVFQSFGERQTVFQWHGDGFDLPRRTVNLAFSDGFPCQAFRYGRAAYALQFHLEVDGALVRHWLGRDSNRREMKAGGFDARLIEEGIARHGDGLKALADSVFGAFLKLV